MNGELEKLQEKLKNLIEEVRIKENEFFSIKAMKKAGKKLSRKDLKYLRDLEIQMKQNYYDIDQLKFQIEEIKQNDNTIKKEDNITEEIDDVEDEQKEEIENIEDEQKNKIEDIEIEDETDTEKLKDESGTYALSHEMIFDNKLNIERKTNNKITVNEENDTTYRLIGNSISENKCEIYNINGAKEKIQDAHQKATQHNKPKEIDGSKIIDIELNDDQNSLEEDYLKKDRRKRIAQDAIIAALLLGIGAAAFKLYDTIEERQKNKENTTTYEPVVGDTNNVYDYENNTVVMPADPYTNVQNYVEIYRAEYEEMRNLYNLTYADAVDYVNRAHSIQLFNFFPEASIDDVVRLLMNIDNKKLFTNDDNGLTSMLVTVIGQVAENAVWGEPTEEDINKMNALQYFAKDGSDLDEFLTELGEINKRVLTDPYNAEEKHNAYLYLRTFIHSFNSYDNMTNYMNEYPESDYGQELSSDLANGEILTDEVLKEKASVKDSYDWYFSYNLTSAFASIYAPIDYNEEEFAKWDDLWMMGETALESPEIQEICNNGLSRTLGGE